MIKKNEYERLEEALKINKPLATVYYMKEELKLFWCQTNKFEAELFLENWLDKAKASKITMLESFAKTIDRSRIGLLNYYDYPISTGPLEGTNNKIKTMKRQAYGFRDIEFFKLKILGLHKSRYELVG